jgi:nicotinamidase-related amidase
MSDAMTTDTLLVVIDPQRAFVDAAGSLARAYGIDEVRPGLEALSRIRQRLAQWRDGRPPVLVRSEYRSGQFTNGRLDHPLTDLCVPGRNVDCEWADGLETACASIITKQEMDAGQTDAYRMVIERAVKEGCRQILLAGFQLTTCVRATALTTVRLVEGRSVRVVVAEDLVGARASSHQRTAIGSRVAATWRELRAAGIIVAVGTTGAPTTAEAPAHTP